MKCPTCKQLLGDRQLIYEQLNEFIHKEYNLGNIDEEQFNKLKKELVNSLNLDRYCCKMRLMTYTQMVDMLK
jgi:DNA-directed RNA polymerase subunit N (RpoN/RPB10)